MSDARFPDPWVDAVARALAAGHGDSEVFQFDGEHWDAARGVYRSDARIVLAALADVGALWTAERQQQIEVAVVFWTLRSITDSISEIIRVYDCAPREYLNGWDDAVSVLNDTADALRRALAAGVPAKVVDAAREKADANTPASGDTP